MSPLRNDRASRFTPLLFALLTGAALFAALGLEGCADGEGSDDELAASAPLAPASLTVTSKALPDAPIGLSWSAQLYASGGAAPYQWQAAGMPAWMQLDAQSGLLWGSVPAAASGFETITATVTDNLGAQAVRQLSLLYTSGSAPQAPIILPAVASAQDGHFTTHIACVNCHTNSSAATAMRDSAGREIAPVNQRRASMMANSFRDPYFRAVLASEMHQHSGLAAVIEDTCLSCHTPQAAYEAHQAGGMQTLGEIYAGNTPRAHIGLDGISCTLCHQMDAANLGTPASFSAGYAINNGKQIYGPHSNPFATPMVNQTGYTPVAGSHMNESSMCGSCHTLHTTVLDLSSNPTGGKFLEQAPYLEWRNSVYSTEVASPSAQAASCQSCHMPTDSQDGVTINTRIARQPGGGDFPGIAPRQPYGRHLLVGANTIMLSILRDNAADLNSPASTAEFNLLIDRTRHMLQNQTAAVQVQNLALAGGTLSFDVQVSNQAGHKFPTAYPSRRAWLRVLVKDGGGQLVWRSGDYDAAGRIVDGTGMPLALEAAGGPIEPHRQLITQQNQVQIYETVHADVTGAPTFSLLLANTHYKDNRVLPQGWSSSHPDVAAIAPVGTGGDGDFVGGSDKVAYQVSGLAGSAYTVEVELVYQTISSREASELFQHDFIREVNVFRQYYQAASRTPELIATTSAQTP